MLKPWQVEQLKDLFKRGLPEQMSKDDQTKKDAVRKTPRLHVALRSSHSPAPAERPEAAVAEGVRLQVRDRLLPKAQCSACSVETGQFTPLFTHATTEQRSFVTHSQLHVSPDASVKTSAGQSDHLSPDHVCVGPLRLRCACARAEYLGRIQTAEFEHPSLT